MKLKQWWPVLKGAYTEFNEDKALRLSGALAYYAMFSIGPILAIAVGVAGLVFGQHQVQQQIQQQLQSLVGEQSAKTISSMMGARKQGSGLLTTIVGIVALLLGAGGVFGQLQDALNTIWEVKPKPGAGLWNFIRTRFLSFAMVLGVGFLLLVSMALTTFLSAVTTSVGNKLPIPDVVAHALNFLVSFGVITVLFAMIFKFLPDIKVPHRKVWVGALGTAILFTIGKHFLAFYLAREGTTSTYGAAASVIVILLWVYYASVILLFGAEFTQVYTRQTGTQLVTTKFSVPVTLRDRAEQGIPREQSSPTAGVEPAAIKPAAASPARQRRRPVRTPGVVVHERPGQFLTLMLAAGFAGATFLALKPLRRVLKLYATLRQTRA